MLVVSLCPNLSQLSGFLNNLLHAETREYLGYLRNSERAWYRMGEMSTVYSSASSKAGKKDDKIMVNYTKMNQIIFKG